MPMAATSTSSHVATIAPSGRRYGHAIGPRINAPDLSRSTLHGPSSMLGGHFALAWIASAPRYRVDQLRVSILFSPLVTRKAHGCQRDSTFMATPP
jgi:hypothetical protein